MAHEKHKFVPKVDYITSPGYGNGAGWREGRHFCRDNIPRNYEIRSCSKEMLLVSIHPGVTAGNILDNMGWPLKITDTLEKTPVPTEYELKVLRELDPEGYWTGS